MAKRPRKSGSLQRVLNAVATPVFLLDAGRKVQFFNDGCERLTGWSAAEVVGQTCDYVSEPDSTRLEALTGSLCPPPSVLQGGTASVPVYVPLRNGQTAGRLLHFHPLLNGAGEVEQILGVVAPLGEPPRVQTAGPAQQLHAELAALRVSLRQRYGLRTVVARSEPMMRVLEQVRLARTSDVPVCLLGEPGVGKEHLARVIHQEGNRRTRSFVPLDGGLRPAIDLKQTLRRLFNADGGRHETAASGAASLQPGTLFLANVDQLPRDLQEMVIEALAAEVPVGGDPPAERVRLIAASEVDLREALEQDRLRRDFYYLITALLVEIPPLRRRSGDLELLAQSLLEDLNRGDTKQVGGFSEAVWEQFRAYNWPGNLDELAAVICEARAACTKDLIQMDDLPFRFRTGREGQTVGPPLAVLREPLEELLTRIEREQIEQALVQSRDNKSRAAELLGLTRARLYRRMEALGIADLEERS